MTPPSRNDLPVSIARSMRLVSRTGCSVAPKASRRRLEEPLEERLEPREDAHAPILARAAPAPPDGTSGVPTATVRGTNVPVGSVGVLPGILMPCRFCPERMPDMSMPDALTESFCERCGTRYEFAAPTELTTMRRARGVLSGLKNYIMSQDSLSDAVGDGIRSQEEVLASAQLDAFHASFNFCIDCRQYACTNCWNEDAGRCQSCQPLPDDHATRRPIRRDPGPRPFHPRCRSRSRATTRRRGQPRTCPSQSPSRRRCPSSSRRSSSRPMSSRWSPKPPSRVEPEPEPMVAEVPEPVVIEPEPVVCPSQSRSRPRFPSQRLSPSRCRPRSSQSPRRFRSDRCARSRDTFLHLPREVPAQDDGIAAAEANEESLAARRAQLDDLGLGDAEEGPIERTRPVLLPYRSSGATPHPADEQAAIAGGAFWDASAREVAGAVTQIGVRSCGHCELSLSASARFCRRCGTPQAQSA